MMKDEIVEQVRQARKEPAAKLTFDLKAILADARKRQKDSGHRPLSFASKPKNPEPTAAKSHRLLRGMCLSTIQYRVRSE